MGMPISCGPDQRIIFGRIVRMIRHAHGLSQAKLREKLCELPATYGRDEAWLSRLENGKRVNIDGPSVLALTEALECIPEEVHALLLAAGITQPTCYDGSDESVRRVWQWYRNLAIQAYSIDLDASFSDSVDEPRYKTDADGRDGGSGIAA